MNTHSLSLSRPSCPAPPASLSLFDEKYRVHLFSHLKLIVQYRQIPALDHYGSLHYQLWVNLGPLCRRFTDWSRNINQLIYCLQIWKRFRKKRKSFAKDKMAVTMDRKCTFFSFTYYIKFKKKNGRLLLGTYASVILERALRLVIRSSQNHKAPSQMNVRDTTESGKCELNDPRPMVLE